MLAAAGLKRLGLAERIRAVFAADQMIPAAGQGALGIEVRSSSAELQQALATLTHTPTWLAVHAERAVSRALGGSCSMPLAAFAQWEGDQLAMSAALGAPDDPAVALVKVAVSRPVIDTTEAEALGQAAAAELRASGGEALLASLAH